MPEETGNCDRCKEPFVDCWRDTLFTAGFYDVSGLGNHWSAFGRKGEKRICDKCMHSDPLYQQR